MQTTYVAQNASVAVVAEPIEAPAWEVDRAPAALPKPKTQPPPEDDLRSARGIFAAVLAGAAIWAALGWGALILANRLLG